MPRFFNPTDVAAPLGAYSHAALSEGGGRTLHVAGQVGVEPDGTVPDDVGAQSELIWRNLAAILKAADMGIEDVVKVNAYLLSPDDLPAFGAVRSRWLGDCRPASTLVYVSGLVKPELKVEVDVVAMKP
ncbi:MAG: RidA family protein [Marivibrio sp.]|uniref:RidA family protein n=1 Tax=Marivibrio sp. TaxID=2039719 RepID=UPI0032EB37F9